MSIPDDKENVMALETDEIRETFALKIPRKTKQMIADLPPYEKKILNQEIMKVMAKVLHDAAFDPVKYLKSEDED